MNENRYCKDYLDPNAPGYIVSYKGNFMDQMDKIGYACGNVITNTLAVVSVREDDIERLKKDVPSIIFVEPKTMYVLQDVPPSKVDSIGQIKSNPYLNFNGKGVLVGLIDTGIDYLNQEFTREDGTTRIINIWDQTIIKDTKDSMDNVYIGRTYNEEDINRALEAYRKGEDPYKIVPSKDEIYHGTKMASIIGARGYNKDIEGVATDCDFAVVKLLPSPNYKMILKENGIEGVEAYNNSEVVVAVEYLRNLSERLKRPIVIYFGVGSNQGSHDGYNITSRYITSVADKRGLVFIAGTGNFGDAELHATNFLPGVGAIDEVELFIPKEIKNFEFYIWVQRPNRMSLSIGSPAGEITDFFQVRIQSIEERNFYITDTKLKVTCYDPENYTGHQLFKIDFTGIKKGVWKLRLKGDIIINGRYDIWLPPKQLLPEGTRFLKSNPNNTLTIPSTARRVVTVAYYNSITNSLVGASGKGFNTNGLINPDIATAGVEILTVSKEKDKIDKISGSSAATAIAAGCSAILLQWGIVEGNDTTMYSTKMRSIFIYAAIREKIYSYPNEDIGYGKLDLLNVFKILGGNYRMEFEQPLECYINNLPIYISLKE